MHPWRDRWALFGRLGLSEERWRSWSPVVQRAVIAGIIGVLLLVVLAPLFGFDATAYITYALFVALYVPSWGRFGRVGRWVIPLAFLALVVTFPYYADSMFTIPILGAFPSTSTGVVMLIYIMMALGLNVVVGYAGLLDLGYVAFYALGAYTCAALASPQFGRSTIQFGAIGVIPCGPLVTLTPVLKKLSPFRAICGRISPKPSVTMAR